MVILKDMNEQQSVHDHGDKGDTTGYPGLLTRGSNVLNHEVGGVQFETEGLSIPKSRLEDPVSPMVTAVIKYSRGIIKNRRQAEWLLLGFAVVAIVMSVYAFLGGGSTQNNITIKPANEYLHPNLRQ